MPSVLPCGRLLRQAGHVLQRTLLLRELQRALPRLANFLVYTPSNSSVLKFGKDAVVSLLKEAEQKLRDKELNDDDIMSFEALGWLLTADEKKHVEKLCAAANLDTSKATASAQDQLEVQAKRKRKQETKSNSKRQKQSERHEADLQELVASICD